jgi:hypothetical protein
MPIYSGFPSAGYKDWDDTSATNAQLTMTYQTDAGGTPTTVSNGYAIMETSGPTATGATITAVTLTWYHSGYTRIGTDTISNSVYLWDGSGYNVHAYTTAAAPASPRYITTALTSAAQLACISVSGGTSTAVKFTVRQPVTNPGNNTWTVNAYESGSTLCTRIGIRYNNAVASSSKRRIFFIG